MSRRWLSASTGYDELRKMKSPFKKDIDKDIRRTFPYHPFYQKTENLLVLEEVFLSTKAL